MGEFEFIRCYDYLPCLASGVYHCVEIELGSGFGFGIVVGFCPDTGPLTPTGSAPMGSPCLGPCFAGAGVGKLPFEEGAADGLPLNLARFSGDGTSSVLPATGDSPCAGPVPLG